MWHLILAAMLAFTTFSDANIKCPTSSLCDCGHFKTRETEKDINCHRDGEAHTQILLVRVEAMKSAVFMCDPRMSWLDFDLLSGLDVGGPMESVMFSFCPLPNAPFLRFFQSFNISGISRFTYHHSNLSNTLDRSQFTGLVNLTELSLNSCGITGLPADIFLDLTKLTTLDLRDNSLILPPHIFDSLSNLQVLELGSNELTHLEKDIFQNLTSLRVLHLWGNKLQNLSREVFKGLSNLEYLELSSNGFRTLPGDIFAEIPKMKELSMYGNNFISLPEGLFSFTPLLRKIKLYDNRDLLQDIPPGLMSNLTSMEEAYLNNCGFNYLPEDTFWGTPDLKNLSLQENALETLDENLFRDTVNMESLDLSYNQLEELPDKVFRNLRNLKILKLDHNRLKNIPSGFFSGTPKLVRLNMENNQLKHVESGAFYHMNNLVHLQLSHNNLTMRNGNFGNSILNDLLNVEEVYLSHNNITEIFHDWATVLIKLRILDLSHNAITVLHDNFPPTLYFGNGEQKKVHRRFLLDGNPIKCDCVLYHLLLYKELKLNPEYYNQYQLETDNLTCIEPDTNESILIRNIRSEKLECSLPEQEQKKCPDPCECSMRVADATLRVYCQHKKLTEVPKLPDLTQFNYKNILMKYLNLTLNHTEAMLAYNNIVKLPTDEYPGYQQVTRLYLSHNNISMLTKENLPPNIQVLELHNNNMTYLNNSVLDILGAEKTGLRHLTLNDNPWECDCKARDLLTFLQEHYKQVKQLPDITCNDGSGRALHNLTITELCPTSSAAIIAVSVIVALLGISIGILAALYYYFHHEVKVWLFARGWCLWFVTEEELDKDKLYDAFISYSHRDEDFVVNELVPQLQKSGFKLCLHYRDWIVGELIPNQIARSVEDSKRTLVVLSPSFLESVWGRMEFRTAHSQALSEGRARVIVLLYGDIGPLDKLDPELRAYLSMNTYVKWGDPWFWNKLRYALPHPQNPENRRGIELKPKKRDDKLELMPSTPPAATTPPTETIINPLDAAKLIPPATNGHATLLAEANGHVNQCFVKSV
ncbi:Protein toll [Blattella germanica]|nr:Protein toll [Blattella germanica]